jgi:enoyl-CoA hydratase/carnithine racemase
MEGEGDMALIDYSLDEDVAVVSLDDGENRFNMPFLERFLDVLEEIETETEANALVVTSSHEKIFCNGIDLDWLVPFIEKGDTAETTAFFNTMMRLFKRILLYPMPTVAAISGHAFAGGAILCCAFDFRYMRSDRGFFCFPEVDLGIPFLPGMLAIITKAIPMNLFEELQYTGSRLTAEECRERRIVSKACHRDDLMGEALGFAKGLKKKRSTILELKKRLYRDIVRVIEEEDPQVIESGVFYV